MNTIQEKKEILNQIHTERTKIRKKLEEMEPVLPRIEIAEVRQRAYDFVEKLSMLDRLHGEAQDAVLDDGEVVLMELCKACQALWDEVHALDTELCDLVAGKKPESRKTRFERALDSARKEAAQVIPKMDRQLDTLSRDGFLDFEKATSYLICVRLIENALDAGNVTEAREWLNAINEIGTLATRDAYHIPLRLRLAAWLGRLQVRFRGQA